MVVDLASILKTSVGARTPAIVGATERGDFFSLDGQAGRPAVILPLHALAPPDAKALMDDLDSARDALAAAGADLVPLAPPNMGFFQAFGGDAARGGQVIYVSEAGGVETAVDGPAIALILDRTGRVVERARLSCAADLIGALTRAAPRLASEAPRACVSAAPVLIVPNLLTHKECRQLIEYFEASAHIPGVMASARDGQAYAKLDESKKRRREMQLDPQGLFGRHILQLLAQQCAPEIKRAFQVDIAHADRILLARYDDDGGYFKRHRDNAAPQVAFREFAISLNLNTQEYEGGELLFPEFNDHRYNPPAGAAIIFSASLLHEAAPVTRGSRYVALSFLSSAAAMQRVAAAS